MVARSLFSSHPDETKDSSQSQSHQQLQLQSEILRRKKRGDMWYLFYFLHRLLDYRLPEVQALAKLFSEEEEEEEGRRGGAPIVGSWFGSDAQEG